MIYEMHAPLPCQVEARDRVGGRSFRAQLKPPVVHEPLWVDEGVGGEGVEGGGIGSAAAPSATMGTFEEGVFVWRRTDPSLEIHICVEKGRPCRESSLEILISTPPPPPSSLRRASQTGDGRGALHIVPDLPLTYLPTHLSGGMWVGPSP